MNYVGLCSKGGKIRETKTRTSYIDVLKGATIYSIQKLPTWLMFRVFTLRDQSVAANCRERVYFEQQILAFLLVCQTHNLSRIKFAHISRQVEGLHIS